MFCSGCGGKIAGENRFCTCCGKPRDGSTESSRPVRGKPTTVAANETIYVTAGAHGFSYRQSLGPKGSSTTGTAPVEDLRESTAAELIENLNRRARISTAPALLALVVILAPATFISLLLISTALARLIPDTRPPQSAITEAESPMAKVEPKSAAEILAATGGVDQILSASAKGKIAVLNFWSKQAKGARQQRAMFERLTSSFRNDPKTVFVLIDRDNYAGLADRKQPGWIIGLETGSTSPVRVKVYGFPTVVIVDVNGGADQLSGNKAWSMSQLKRAIADAEAQPPKMSTSGQPPTPEVRAASQAPTPNDDVVAEVAFLVTAIVGAVAAERWRRRIVRRKQMNLVYKLNEATTSQFAHIQRAFGTLGQAKRLWRIISETPTYDWKRNAGTSVSLKRTPVRCGTLAMPSVSANVSVIGLNVGSIQIYPLPDQILYRDAQKYAVIQYSHLTVVGSQTRFVEMEGVPRDAKTVGETWRFVNKGGGPDRRFNNNRKIPVVEYGHLTLTSTAGFNLQLQVSSLASAFEFAAAFTPHRNHTQSERPREKENARSNPRSEQRRAETPPPRLSEKEQAAAMLGIPVTASAAEISIAYRNMAQLYHPDKVAGLGPELRALAEQKMKDINHAHEVLKRPGG